MQQQAAIIDQQTESDTQKATVARGSGRGGSRSSAFMQESAQPLMMHLEHNWQQRFKSALSSMSQ
jgi:hypothetical protein